MDQSLHHYGKFWREKIPAQTFILMVVWVVDEGLVLGGTWGVGVMKVGCVIFPQLYI
jgi:hypothetical protein